MKKNRIKPGEERLYVIPLRRAFIRAPNYEKTKRAVSELRIFIKKHMKVEKVKIGEYLNLKMWERGRKNPFPKIKVKTKIEDDYAMVELPEFEFQKKKEEKKEKSAVEKVQEKIGIKEKKEKKSKKEKELKEMEEEIEKKEKHHIKGKEVKNTLTKEQEKLEREKRMMPESEHR